MPKRDIPLLTGSYYHVFNRGNNKGKIFIGSDDFERLFKKVEEYSRLYPLEIHSYCLLSNHLHFLVRQVSENFPISKFFGSLLNSHAQYINLRYGMVGHLIQGRFKAKPLESEASLLQTSRYIHLNPIKEKLLKPSFIKEDSKNLSPELKKDIRLYPWSSYRYFLRENQTQPKFLKASDILETAGNRRSYQSFVESKITIENINEIEALEKPR